MRVKEGKSLGGASEVTKGVVMREGGIGSEGKIIQKEREMSLCKR